MQKIIVFSDDNFLVETLKEVYGEENILVNSEETNGIVICDEVNKNLKNYKYTINISKEENKNATINIRRPFKLGELFSTIEDFLKNSNEVIQVCETYVDFKNGSIKDCNEKELEKLTGKELDILRFLFKNSKVTKEDLLTKVWGYSLDNLSNLETKVVESTIYKIRKKFKTFGVKNSIIFDNGYYRLENG